jgi:hypothetical protein
MIVKNTYKMQWIHLVIKRENKVEISQALLQRVITSLKHETMHFPTIVFINQF